MTPSDPDPSVGPLRPGAWVFVRPLGRQGKVLSVDPEKGAARVEVGPAAWNFSTSDLEPIAPPAGEASEASPTAAHVSGPAHELDLHGLGVEESLEALESFLHSAAMHGLVRVRIVHGRGTGKVREAVRARLAADPRVREFHFAAPAEGGPGATIVGLRPPAGR
jgi:DNA mismatch repair protein MutS2